MSTSRNSPSICQSRKEIFSKRLFNMWKSHKLDVVNEKNDLFHDLLDELKYCTVSRPSHLPYTLRNRLEKFPQDVRRDIVNRVKVGCTPLFMACKKGLSEIVEYLISVCQADIELKGFYEVPEDRSKHIVTPLWCAAVSGKLSVVEVLLKYNANINAVSDTGSTPVRSACFMSHLDIVKCLVEHGADLNRPNYNGGTCLINSVQSAPLCEFLLKHGADVNARDIQNKTALHYAIKEHRFETTKLLLRHGADYNARSRNGDDALQMACIKGAVQIFQYLIGTIWYPEEKLANAHELLGATVLDEQNDMITGLFHWRKALAYRLEKGLLPKRPELTLHPSYGHKKEFESVDELENIATDMDEMRMQSLLIVERILGPCHKDTIFRLMYRGAAYADMLRYQCCIDVWKRALELRVEKDTILYHDTLFTANALVRQIFDYYDKVPLRDEEDLRCRFQDVHDIFTLITRDVATVQELLTIRPIFNKQYELYDKTLRCVTHLIYSMVMMATGHEDLVEVVRTAVTPLVREFNVRSCINGDTLLHLSVSLHNTIKSRYFQPEDVIYVFPSDLVVKFLLECGADVSAKNEFGSTALHIATELKNYDNGCVMHLLQYGAHIDQPNARGIRPSDCLQTASKQHDVNPLFLNHINLRCMAANVISKFQIPYKNQIPKTLECFVKMHEP